MHTCVNSINNIDGSLADDRFIEALLCNWRHTVITVICTGRIRRPGPARPVTNQARPGPWPTFYIQARPGPARGPPGPCRSLIPSPRNHASGYIVPSTHFDWRLWSSASSTACSRRWWDWCQDRWCQGDVQRLDDLQSVPLNVGTSVVGHRTSDHGKPMPLYVTRKVLSFVSPSNLFQGQP